MVLPERGSVGDGEHGDSKFSGVVVAEAGEERTRGRRVISFDSTTSSPLRFEQAIWKKGTYIFFSTSRVTPEVHSSRMAY